MTKSKRVAARQLAEAKAIMTGPVPCAGCGSPPTAFAVEHADRTEHHLWCNDIRKPGSMCSARWDTDSNGGRRPRTEAEAVLKWNRLQKRHVAWLASGRKEHEDD